MASGERPSRRELLLGAAAFACLGGLGAHRGGGEERGALRLPGRAVLVRDRELLGASGRPDPQRLRRMLNDGVAALFGLPAAEAWRSLFRAGDLVGIKSNVWHHLPTPPELEEAIRAELTAAGVAADRIAVDDRGVLDHPLFARATALVNVRPLRTHHWSGLGTCLKNLIMFSRTPWEYHGDACASLGSLWQLPAVRGKVRLNILVLLTPQFHGIGPHSFSPRFVWPYRGLLIGTDPVAVDATGERLIAAQRRRFFGEPRPISPPAHHIRLAESRYGLGVADPARIELVRRGWEEEALI